MKSIPSYALYGEAESEGQDWLHWETIQSRSRLHDYRIAPHRHEQFFQVVHLTGGWAGVSIDAQQYQLSAPAVVVVPALSVHAYQFSSDVDGVVVTLMDRDMREAGELKAGVITGDGEVGEAIDRLIAEADRPLAGHARAMRALIALLVVSIQRARQASETEEQQMSGRSALHAQAFRWMVDRRFRETRRIADYADALGISPTHLNRVCREALGCSALAVVERRIALEARRQLLFSTLTIKQIGAELGYDDPAYFSRVLSRVLQVAPGVYRQRALEAAAEAEVRPATPGLAHGR